MNSDASSKLLKILRCNKCGSSHMDYDQEVLTCSTCKTHYKVINGIPSMVEERKTDNQAWNSHDSDQFDKGADSYYKRATGELPEKEASKSLARFLEEKNIYSSGERILDLGCAAGHFLKSLRRILDPDIDYTGVDVSMKYLQWAREIYGISKTTSFVQCDALNMPFNDSSFETVYANLFHFFPNIGEALEESMRVSKNRVLWRTPLGETTYVVKEIFEDSYESIGAFDARSVDCDYTLYMIYSEEYIRGLAESKGWDVEFIERDDDFESFDNRSNFQDVPATRVVDGKQINGNLILDWHYVSIFDGVI